MVHRARTVESRSGLYRESCAIVLRHYRRPLTVAVVARALASSPRQLQRAFEEVGGTTFSAYLREVRLRNAAQPATSPPRSWATRVTNLISVFHVGSTAAYASAPSAAGRYLRACGGLVFVSARSRG